jgi:hypothetical protein
LTRLRLLHVFYTLYIVKIVQLWRFSTFKPYNYTLYGSGSVSKCVNPAPHHHIWLRLRPTLYGSGSAMRQTAPHQLVWGLLRNTVHCSGSGLSYTAPASCYYIRPRLHTAGYGSGSGLSHTAPAPGYRTRLRLRAIAHGSRPVFQNNIIILVIFLLIRVSLFL